MIRAVGLSCTSTSHSIRFDTNKHATHHLAWNLLLPFQIQSFLVIERDNPAASSIVAAAASWVLERQEVLKDQQKTLYVALGLLLGTLDGSHSCLPECDHLFS